MLPNFIGIGAPRSGSTWLHESLRAHPNVYLPRQRKELNFFNQNYSGGIDWYEKYFPPDHASNRSRAVGEISPIYMSEDNVPKRLKKMGTVRNLIAILRNPVDRLYSQYGQAIQYGLTAAPFRKYATEDPWRIRTGYHSEFLNRFLEYYDE